MQGFILPELKSYAITIREDSKGAIKLANNKYSSCRTRHIEVKHHIVLDTIGRGKARFLSVETQKQHAKILNKPLNLKLFAKHAGALMDVNYIIHS